MGMSFQGNLSQAFPSDPSCCPLWPSSIVNQKEKKNIGGKTEKTGSQCFVAYLIFTDRFLLSK